jgi:putative transposase
VPEAVTVALGEIVADVGEGLLATAVGTGLGGDGRDDGCGRGRGVRPKGKHNPNRSAVRHGTEKGSVTLGGRRVPVQRPRMRAIDGSGELLVPS